MRLLSFSDIYSIELSIEKLQSIIESEKIDAVVLLGGLFSEKPKHLEVKSKTNPKSKKNIVSPSTNILELNWLLIPIFVVPDNNDLKYNKLIRQIQGQEAIWIRYIYNKGTILDNWFIFSITESESDDDSKELFKTVEEYAKVAPDRSVLLYTGQKKMQFPNVHTILISKDNMTSNTNSFLVTVDSLKEKTVTIIDLDKKTVNSMLLE